MTTIQPIQIGTLVEIVRATCGPACEPLVQAALSFSDHHPLYAAALVWTATAAAPTVAALVLSPLSEPWTEPLPQRLRRVSD